MHTAQFFLFFFVFFLFFFFKLKVPHSSLSLVIVYGAFAFGSQNNGCEGNTANDAPGEARSCLTGLRGPQPNQTCAPCSTPLLLPCASPPWLTLSRKDWSKLDHLLFKAVQLLHPPAAAATRGKRTNSSMR